MNFQGVLIIALILMWIYRFSTKGGSMGAPAAQSSSPQDSDAQATAEALRTRLPERSLPLHLDAMRGVGARFFARWLKGFETRIDTDEPPGTIRISLYCPRKIFYFDVFVPPAVALHLKSVQVQLATGEPLDIWGMEYHEDGQRTRIRVCLPRKELTRSLTLDFSGYSGEITWEVKIRVLNDEYRDYDLLLRSMRDSDEGKTERAREACLEYMEFCDHNPLVLLMLGSAHANRGELDRAEACFLSAAVTGLTDLALKRYGALQDGRPWIQNEELRRLCGEADEWKLPEQHGAVVLRRNEECVLGLHGWYLKRSSETLRIRRDSAGRLMANPQFSVGSHERLVFTRARCIAADGTARPLPDEQFTFREDPGANPTITTRVERAGSWILPDLKVGDVVEWSYDLLCRERRSGETPEGQAFIVTRPAHSFFPTLEGSVTVRWKESQAPMVKLSNAQDGLVAEEAQEEDWHSRRIKLRRYIPRQATGAPFHRLLLNPAVTCATVHQDWDSVARSNTRFSFGQDRLEKPLPALLAGIASKATHAEQAMQTAFYWIRDNLKYAALKSAESNIGGSSRAESIIKAGVGDCKDRSYLLYLMARHLEIPAQFLFVSSEYGVIYEDVPGDQFDHVFVRVQLEGRWRYLDATNEQGVFGSVPVTLQGMKALAVAERGEIIQLPIDPPDANTLEVVEAFATMYSGWLYGTYHLRLQGNLARIADCHLKRYSLQMNNQEAAAQIVLRNYLPGLELLSLTCVSETSRSDVLELAGTQRRCHLADLGSLNVGFVTWSESLLPLNQSLALDENGVFAFAVPVQLSYEVRFHGKLLGLLNSWSPPLNFKNSIGAVCSIEERSSERLVIGRTVEIPNKYIEGSRVQEVKDYLNALERALQVAVAFMESTDAEVKPELVVSR